MEAFSAESGGMPQLNPEFWISQIFWLTLTFGILYLVLSKLILPKISANLESRKSQILENIEAAEKQREDSETKLKEYEEIISKSRLDAKTIFNQAREKALKDINAKREVLDKQIDDEIVKAEEEIKTLRKSAPDKITYKIPKVSVSQNIWEIQNSGFNWGIPPLSAAKTSLIKKKLKNINWKNIFLIINLKCKKND